MQIHLNPSSYEFKICILGSYTFCSLSWDVKNTRKDNFSLFRIQMEKRIFIDLCDSGNTNLSWYNIFCKTHVQRNKSFSKRILYSKRILMNKLLFVLVLLSCFRAKIYTMCALRIGFTRISLPLFKNSLKGKYLSLIILNRSIRVIVSQIFLILPYHLLQ